MNDFRKICAIEAYCPTDNVAELTARVNDDGWESAYAEWLKVSWLSSRDAVLVFSVSWQNRKPLRIVVHANHQAQARAQINGLPIFCMNSNRTGHGTAMRKNRNGKAKWPSQGGPPRR